MGSAPRPRSAGTTPPAPALCVGITVTPGSGGVSLYRTDLNPDPAVTANKLLPTMLGPPDRYLVPDQRDFFAVSTR